MITIRFKDGTFLFGIDANNLRNMHEGQPLYLNFEKFGGQGKALVFFSETLDQVHAQMSEFIGTELPPIGTELTPKETH
jgi:hypothetical protein